MNGSESAQSANRYGLNAKTGVFIAWVLVICGLMITLVVMMSSSKPVPADPTAQREAQFGSKTAELEDKIARNPQDIDSILNLGATYLDQDKPQEAMDYFNRALAVDQSNAAGNAGVGAANEQLGDYDKALEYYEKSIQVAPTYDFPQVQKASILANQKQQYDAALAILAVVEKRMPPGPEKARVTKLIANVKTAKGQ